MADSNNQPMVCQCDELAEDFGVGFLYDPLTERPYVAHAPGECKCVNDLKLCTRDGKQLWLCSNCRIAGDEKVTEDVYVLIHEDPYDEGDKVYGVFTSQPKAEKYVQDYVNDHEGEGKDDFRVIDYTLDRPYT